MKSKNNDHFIYSNPNPLQKKAGDCVIRAISLAFDKDWYEVYDELTALGRKLGDLPNVSEVYSPYIEQLGGIKISPFVQLEGGRKRLTGLDLTKRDGTYIIRTAHHLAVVMNHNVWDTWDSSSKAAYKIWRVA